MTREDAGPFIVLGVDKDADTATIEAQYQARLFPARRGELTWSVSDLDWAQEQLSDAERRVAADAESWNIDNAAGDVRRLMRLYRLENNATSWEPLDPEPPVTLPEPTMDMAAIMSELQMPDAPLDLPAISAWLANCGSVGANPWAAEVLGG